MRCVLLLWCCLAVELAMAQEVRPEDVGFRAVAVETAEGVAHAYVSTGGQPADTLQTRPLLVYLQGSGYSPLFTGAPDRLSHVLMLKPTDFPDMHVVVIGKPAAPFWAREREAAPAAYHEALTLQRRVSDASSVIDHLSKQAWVDTSQIVVVGHSEGAQVAPALAAHNPRVTHVAALAASGISQANDFVLMIRQRVRAGDLAFEDGEQRIAALHEQIRRIEASPTAADSLWRGHSYRRWASFFAPPLPAFLSLDIPVFVGVGVYDEASPIESADTIPIAFLRAGKTNLTYTAWPTDHRFQETTASGARVDRRPDVVAALMAWMNEDAGLAQAE